MNFLSKASLRVIKGTNVREREEGSLGILLLGAGILLALAVLILFMVGLKGTKWFWNLLETLLESIRFWPKLAR